VLTAPWWLTTIRRHGLDVFSAAAGTHGGILSLTWPVSILTQPPAPLPSLWPALIALCAIYLVVRGEWFLPAWMIATGFLLGREDHLLVIGALMIGVCGARYALPGVRTAAIEAAGGSERARSALTGTAAVGFVTTCLVAYGLLSAGLFVAGLPTFADGEDREMMGSLEDGSAVAVVGDAGEWLGYYGNVTHTSTLREMEWTGQFRERAVLRTRLTNCLSAECVSTALADHEITANYLYVALDGYSNAYPEALSDLRRHYLGDSLNASEEFAFEKRSENVLVYAIRNGTLGPAA
jgi:hypothetical protein